MNAKLSENPDIPTLKGWITIPEAAVKLGISRQYAYKRATDGFFSSLHRLGDEMTTFIVSTEEVDKLVNARVRQEFMG